jgi:hypothetical protein
MIPVYFLMGVLLGACSMGKVTPETALALPDALEGWKVSAKDQTYNRDTLYEYIDGGAELYLSYGFEHVINRTYSKPGQPDMVVDLFDMGSSRNAYGVFSHSRETVDDTFGQGSQYAEGLLLFWKDRYYVSILTFPETDESKRAIFDLAGKIESTIAQEGPLPEILEILPERLLIKESIRYFHHHAWLNSHYFVADKNILHINDTTDALLAKYGENKKWHLLLLVNYSSAKDAEHARSDFIKYYLPVLSGRKAVQIEDGTWTACQLEENTLIIVFNASQEDKALQLIEAVHEKMLNPSLPLHGEG